MTDADPQPALDIREQLARIDREMADAHLAQADARKRDQDIRYAPWLVGFSGLTAGAALMGAALALFKVLGL